SFDDQYLDCSQRMSSMLFEVNITEFKSSEVYSNAWKKAAAEWQKKERPKVLSWEQATALMAYTLPGRISKVFNEATRQGGGSCQHYFCSYHFKGLHFLLSQALRTLRESQPRRCYQVYRGVRGIRFTAQKGQSVRFGQFTSSSRQKKSTERFGQDTLFSVETCYGVPIKDFSFYPEEDEVLIPPSESFKVMEFTQNNGQSRIRLLSEGPFSTCNCQLMKCNG
ncbi:NRT1 ribosyltransferase, partial [Penelope pileata]|nr:NRT1 ribosyltransferase [Penelope pileata]